MAVHGTAAVLETCLSDLASSAPPSTLERALVVYIGAQKCYVAMYKDLARGLRSPLLAYVSPQILEQQKGRSSKIVVGDDVLVLPMREAFKVTKALPRRNLFQRSDAQGRARALAANLGWRCDAHAGLGSTRAPCVPLLAAGERTQRLARACAC
jgi:hypothetical protein